MYTKTAIVAALVISTPTLEPTHTTIGKLFCAYDTANYSPIICSTGYSCVPNGGRACCINNNRFNPPICGAMHKTGLSVSNPHIVITVTPTDSPPATRVSFKTSTSTRKRGRDFLPTTNPELAGTNKTNNGFNHTTSLFSPTGGPPSNISSSIATSAATTSFSTTKGPQVNISSPFNLDFAGNKKSNNNGFNATNVSSFLSTTHSSVTSTSTKPVDYKTTSDKGNDKIIDGTNMTKNTTTNKGSHTTSPLPLRPSLSKSISPTSISSIITSPKTTSPTKASPSASSVPSSLDTSKEADIASSIASKTNSQVIEIPTVSSKLPHSSSTHSTLSGTRTDGVINTSASGTQSSNNTPEETHSGEEPRVGTGWGNPFQVPPGTPFAVLPSTLVVVFSVIAAVLSSRRKKIVQAYRLLIEERLQRRRHSHESDGRAPSRQIIPLEDLPRSPPPAYTLHRSSIHDGEQVASHHRITFDDRDLMRALSTPYFDDRELMAPHHRISFDGRDLVRSPSRIFFDEEELIGFSFSIDPGNDAEAELAGFSTAPYPVNDADRELMGTLQ